MLKILIKFIYKNFNKIPIYKLHSKIESEINNILAAYIEDVSLALKYLHGALSNQQSDNVYMSGITNLLLQPEFNDVEKINSLYSMIEQEDLMTNLLRASKEGIRSEERR